jgi:type III secretion protein R
MPTGSSFLSTPIPGPELGANPITTVVLLAVLSLLPFLLMMLTSFLKFSVVLSILRVALGTQQIPPAPVIMGLSIILSLYVMAPLASEVYAKVESQIAADDRAEVLSPGGAKALLGSLSASKEPIRKFLEKHAHKDDVAVFYVHAQKSAAQRSATVGGEAVDEVKESDLLVLMPAFAISELAEAFAIGFLIFLPFLIIDMVISNILLAMGMHMLSPVVVSLPFKLLLFIMVDGWRYLAQGLMQPYIH